MATKKPKQKYYIYIPGLGEEADAAEEFLSAFTEPTMIASEYAEYIYSDRDGWDWMKPGLLYEVVIIYPSGKFVTTEISFDLEPMFFATKKHETNDIPN